jgi:hypothetical protein
MFNCCYVVHSCTGVCPSLATSQVGFFIQALVDIVLLISSLISVSIIVDTFVLQIADMKFALQMLSALLARESLMLLSRAT